VSSRALRGLLAAATLVLAALLVWYYLMGAPQYSFYRFALAIQGHDAAAAERFVDVDRVALAASDVIVAEYLRSNAKAAHAIEALGQGAARSVAGQAVTPLVAARVRGELRKMAKTGGQGPSVLVLPAGMIAAFSGLAVERDAEGAWVIYTDPRRGQTRFRMNQQPDRSWRITEFDPGWVRRHLKDGSAG
jgi:predicted nucleic acid-binding protein